MKKKMLVFAAAVTLFGANIISYASQAGSAATQKMDIDQRVLPILRQSCFACHMPGSWNPPPSLPEAMVRKTRKMASKAQGDFEMGPQFPFPNEDKVGKQLEHLTKELKDRSMPPKSQKELGMGVPLTEAQRKMLLDWVTGMKRRADAAP